MSSPSDPRADELRAVLAHDAGLAALLRAARERYVQAGAWTSPTLALDTPELRRAAAALGCGGRRDRLSLRVLGEALARTRFRCSVEEAVRWAFGDVPATRAALRTARDASWEAQSASLLTHAGPAAEEVAAWLTRDGPTLRGEWHRDGALLAAVAVRAAAAARHLAAPEVVPVLAHRLTGDPHALDVGRAARRYFERILVERHAELGLTVPLSAGARADLLAASNLAADGISSLVWAVGLTGDPVLAAARDAWYPLALPLVTVTALRDVSAARATVFAVENRSVFGALVPDLGRLPVADRPTVLCTSGNPSLAARVLLARLAAQGATVYYGGDTDARGLRITRALEASLAGRLVRWHMNVPEGVVQYQEAKLPAMADDLRGVAHPSRQHRT